jgi:hypothetical protein
VVSAADLYGRNLGLLDRSRYFFYKLRDEFNTKLASNLETIFSFSRRACHDFAAKLRQISGQSSSF